MADNEREFRNFVRGIKFDDTPDYGHRDSLEQDLRAALAKQTRRDDQSLRIWRIIMKSRITKLAAAAVIIVAALIVVSQFDGSVGSRAFAEVVRPILSARTAIFNVSVAGQNAPALDFKVMWAEPGYARQEMPNGTIIIGDLEQGKVLVLLTAEKKAMLTSLEGQPKVVTFSQLRQLIRDAQEGKNGTPEYLGEQRVDGRDAVGYRVIDPDWLDVTIWADTETLLPVRMECPRGDGQGIVALTDFEFDVELDPMLFSFDIPDGYSVIDHFDPDLMEGPAP